MEVRLIQPPVQPRLLLLNAPAEVGFSSTKAGSIARRAVRNATCEATVIDMLGTERLCGLPATGTVDVDVLGNQESFPVCSDPRHRRALRLDLVAELASQGHFTVPGENGLGRS